MSRTKMMTRCLPACPSNHKYRSLVWIEGVPQNVSWVVPQKWHRWEVATSTESNEVKNWGSWSGCAVLRGVANTTPRWSWSILRLPPFESPSLSTSFYAKHQNRAFPLDCLPLACWWKAECGSLSWLYYLIPQLPLPLLAQLAWLLCPNLWKECLCESPWFQVD